MQIVSKAHDVMCESIHFASIKQWGCSSVGEHMTEAHGVASSILASPMQERNCDGRKRKSLLEIFLRSDWKIFRVKFE